MADFLQAVLERVVIYDGAMGTNIQFRNPSVDDFWGKEGCNELLALSRPDIIKDIHTSFFAVGCDVVRSEEHTSELQSRPHLVCRLLLEKKKHCTVRRTPASTSGSARQREDHSI